METLALFGGRPVRQTLLPYARQSIDQSDIDAVTEVLQNDYLTTGPRVAQFERDFARYVGAKYAVAVSSGTAALHAACFAAGIGPGDEVITTPITFAASANCVLYMGGKPVFADIDPQTYNIDPEEIKKKITCKTKAIIPVHFTGQPVDLTSIHEIAREYGLTVIEDAAHALGAKYRGWPVGGLSAMTVFSFHPVKHITTGEGGIITTDDEQLYEMLLLFRTHGITRATDRFTRTGMGTWYYEQQFLGYNYRLTDIQAALGLSQLKKLDKFIARRKEIVSAYNTSFAGLAGIRIPHEKNECESSWHLYVITIDKKVLKADRALIFQALKAENIGVNVHYIPVYHHPFYQELGYIRGLCPQAEEFYKCCLSLPLFPAMGIQDVQDVISGVSKVVRHFT